MFEANTCLPVESNSKHPRCVTINGIDYDIEPILAEHRRDWTWPGGTEQSLRDHLKAEHDVTGIEKLSRSELAKIHAVIHEREKKTRSIPAAPPVVKPLASPSRCPGGVCPSPTVNRPRGGFLFRWR